MFRINQPKRIAVLVFVYSMCTYTPMLTLWTSQMDILLVCILMHFRISPGLAWAWLLVWNDSWTFKLDSNSSNFMDLHFSWIKYREMIYYCYILGCFLTSQSSLIPLSSRTKQVLSRNGQEETWSYSKISISLIFLSISKHLSQNKGLKSFQFI